MKVGDLVLVGGNGEKRHRWKMGLIVEELKPMATSDQWFQVRIGNETVRKWAFELFCEEVYRNRVQERTFQGPLGLPWGR